MNLRAAAFVIVLAFGVGPVAGAVCELACDRSAATPATPDCHGDAEAGGTSVRAFGQPCAHTHATLRAVVTGPSVRSAAAPFVATLMPQLIAAAAQGSLVPLTHGPPDSILRPASLSTVLRI